MEQWREQLTINPIFIAENEAFAAIINRQTIAFHALLQRADVLRLEHLWVLPDWMGQGSAAPYSGMPRSGLRPVAHSA